MIEEKMHDIDFQFFILTLMHDTPCNPHAALLQLAQRLRAVLRCPDRTDLRAHVPLPAWQYVAVQRVLCTIAHT
jgi:hypothetical protein